IALTWIARRRPEITEIVGRAPGMKFVIPRGRACPVFHPSPGRVVAIEILLCAVRIGEISHGHYGARNLFQKLCRGFRSRKILAVCNIHGPNEDGRLRSGFGSGCRRSPMCREGNQSHAYNASNASDPVFHLGLMPPRTPIFTAISEHPAGWINHSATRPRA